MADSIELSELYVPQHNIFVYVSISDNVLSQSSLFPKLASAFRGATGAWDRRPRPCGSRSQWAALLHEQQAASTAYSLLAPLVLMSFVCHHRQEAYCLNSGVF